MCCIHLLFHLLVSCILKIGGQSVRSSWRLASQTHKKREGERDALDKSCTKRRACLRIFVYSRRGGTHPPPLPSSNIPRHLVARPTPLLRSRGWRPAGRIEHSTNQHRFLPLFTSVFLRKRQIGLRDLSSSAFGYFYALLFFTRHIHIINIYINNIPARVHTMHTPKPPGRKQYTCFLAPVS